MDFSTIDYNALLDAAVPQRDPHNLFEPIRYTLSQGGKRIRPTLTLMACELFGEDPHRALPAALAIEMFHNFTLIHDDIMDQAPLRRGQPTVYQRWDPNTAILSGDALFALAYERLAQCDPAILPELLHAFNHVALGVCEGQQFDLDFERRKNVTIDEYIEMIRLKTSVLIGGALNLGAIISHAPAIDRDLIYEFGETIGIAFQLQDDLLDTYHFGDDFGKVVGGDIAVNKKTYLYLSALHRSDTTQRTLLEHYYCGTDFPQQEKLNAVVSIFNDLNIRQHTEDAIGLYYSRAMRALDLVNVPNERKSALRAFAASLQVRDH